MDDEYNLSAGEAVIMQSDGVELLCGRESEELDELVLTNKNLILVNEVSVGIFTTQRLVKRCPLDSILCPEGSPPGVSWQKEGLLRPPGRLRAGDNNATLSRQRTP